jgi:hypothetical protein
VAETRHEYAFDVKLVAVVRVKAESLETARESLKAVLDCVDMSDAALEGFNNEQGRTGISAKVTEVSLSVDDVGFPCLIEIDEEAV